MDGLCKCGNLDRAFRLFHKLCFKGLVPNLITYNTLISGCCKRGSFSEALKLLGRMIKEGIAPSVITYSAFLSSLSHHGNVKEYTKFLDEMQEDLATDSIRHCRSFEGIVNFPVSNQFHMHVPIFFCMLNAFSL